MEPLNSLKTWWETQYVLSILVRARVIISRAKENAYEDEGQTDSIYGDNTNDVK